MTKWEYSNYVISHRGFINLKLPEEEFRELFQESGVTASRSEEERHIRDGNIIHYKSLLSALGRKGWELVCVVQEELGKKEMYFKRQAEEPPTQSMLGGPALSISSIS